MKLKKIEKQNVNFVYECLKELRGEASYSILEFENYIFEYLDNENSTIYIGYDDNQPIGIITCNKFAIPRYLGFGYEFEEVVIHPSFQSKGYGKVLVDSLLNEFKRDPLVRKIIVKTDDLNIAGKLYTSYFDTTDVTVFSKNINYL